MLRTGLVAWIIVAALLAGCSTTTKRIKPSEHALERRGVEAGDVVLLRYRSAQGSNSSNRSEEIEVTAIGPAGIVGVGADGEIVVANYEDLLQVESQVFGFSGVPGAERGGNVLKGISKTALLAACIAVGAQC